MLSFAVLLLAPVVGGPPAVSPPPRLVSGSPTRHARPAPARAFQVATAHVDALFDGVEEIAAPKEHGGVCAFGDAAFVVLTFGGVPVIAAADPAMGADVPDGRPAKRSEGGRLLVVGHDAYLGEELAYRDTARFVENALAWLTRGKRSPRIVCPTQPDFAEALRGLGFKASADPDLSRADCAVIDGERRTSRARVEELWSFQQRGGSLLVIATGHAWQARHPDRVLGRDLPGNRLLERYGLAFSHERLGATDNGFRTLVRPHALAHAGRSLELLIEQGERLDPESRTRATARVRAALACLHDHEPTLVLPVRRRLASGSPGAVMQELALAEGERAWRPLAERWSEWRVLGPFASTKADVERSLPPEAALGDMAHDGSGPDLARTWRSGRAKLGWRRLQVLSDGRDLDVGEIDFVDVLDTRRLSESAAVYLYRRVEADQEREHGIQVGADDGVRVWWNGELVLDRPRAEPIDAERIDHTLRLRRGTNHLLVKVVNDEGAWRFRMRAPRR